MIPHSTVNTTATSHHVGAAVQYQCIPGYPERSGTLACVEGDNGEGYWVGETISCTKPRVTSTEAQTAITSLGESIMPYTFNPDCYIRLWVITSSIRGSCCGKTTLV